MKKGWLARGGALAGVLFACGLAQAAQAQANGEQAGAAHGAADYAALPFVEHPALSPNGEWVAGLYPVSGEREICMVNLFGTLADRKCVLLPDLTEADSVQWVGNDNIVVRVRELNKLRPGERRYMTRVIGLNRLTGNVTKPLWELLGQNASDVLWRARDGSPTVLLAAQQSLYNETVDRFRGNSDALFWPAVFRVNMATGSAQKIMPGVENVMDWRADAAGKVREAIFYRDDRGLSAAMYRGEKEDLMHALKLGSDGQVIEPELFLPGGDHAVVIRNGDEGRKDDKAGREDKAGKGDKADKGAPRPPAALWEVDLATGADVGKLYEAPPGRTISATLPAPDGSAILGLELTGARDEWVWLDKGLADLQASLQKAVGERRVSILSMSEDRQRLLVKVDRADSPGALYLFDFATGKLHALAVMNEKLGNAPLNPVRAVSYKARDGLEIEAILTLPKGREAKGLPVVVMPHGGPWAHDTLDYDYWAQFVASLGYAVIQPNFRGSTGYGEAFERKGDGQMGLAMQDDINDALAWAVKEGIADGKRACLVGASYGGYATMWGLARDPDMWRCGVSVSGVANLRREVNDMDDMLYSRTSKAAWRAMTPDFAAVSPIKAVDRIKAPLLLVHGKRDVTVDSEQSDAMAGKMKGAGKPVEYLLLPKADHYFTRAEDRLALLNAIEAFLKKNNPAD